LNDLVVYLDAVRDELIKEPGRQHQLVFPAHT
jgi:hypothetical protein